MLMLQGNPQTPVARLSVIRHLATAMASTPTMAASTPPCGRIALSASTFSLAVLSRLISRTALPILLGGALRRLSLPALATSLRALRICRLCLIPHSAATGLEMSGALAHARQKPALAAILLRITHLPLPTLTGQLTLSGCIRVPSQLRMCLQ
jgi:hypothetical protein